MKEECGQNRELLAQETILKAVVGNEAATQEIIKCYRKNIHQRLVYAAQKRGINLSYMPLADMEQEALIHLIYAIQKFKL